MKRISVVVSDEAWKIIKRYQRNLKIGTRDEAIDRFIREREKA